jgi:lysophospholipase L1-like esterase
MNKFTFLKSIITFFLSFLLFLSFRKSLVYENDIFIFCLFIFFIFITVTTFFIKKAKLRTISINIFIIIILNLLTTPLFFQKTFDVPFRLQNYTEVIDYKSDFFDGMWEGKHTITTDHKGYRTNKKIDYLNKSNNSIRLFTLGASTTEENGTDDNKTWTSLLTKDLSNYTSKEIELINMGLAGLRIHHHYVSLKNIKKFKPDIIVFLIGINDWNHHIVNDKNYIFPYFEIKYEFTNSTLFKIVKNIKKQINRKFIKNDKKEIKVIKNTLVPNELKKQIINGENYYFAENTDKKFVDWLKPMSNSLEKEVKKKFKPNNVSEEYNYWINLIIKECKSNKYKCFFINQPTGYNTKVSDKLKKRFWMTPPNQDFTLDLDSMIHISSIYNNYLENIIKKNQLSFCDLSSSIEPNTKYLIDDCHYTEKGSSKVSKVISECLKKKLISENFFKDTL